MTTKRTVHTSKCAAVARPGKEDVAGAMHKYCEENTNGAEDGEEEDVVTTGYGLANARIRTPPTRPTRPTPQGSVRCRRSFFQDAIFFPYCTSSFVCK